MHHLHIYPDLRTMFRRLLIATVVGILAAFAVAGFRHAMLLLEWLFLNNDSGSLVNAATNLSPWRRLLTPALGGLAAGLLLMGWQKFTQQRPHAPTDYMEALLDHSTSSVPERSRYFPPADQCSVALVQKNAS